MYLRTTEASTTLFNLKDVDHPIFRLSTDSSDYRIETINCGFNLPSCNITNVELSVIAKYRLLTTYSLKVNNYILGQRRSHLNLNRLDNSHRNRAGSVFDTLE